MPLRVARMTKHFFRAPDGAAPAVRPPLIGISLEVGLKLVSAALGVASTLLLARALTARELGVFSIVAAVVSIIATTSEYPKRQAMLHDVAAGHGGPLEIGAYVVQRFVIMGSAFVAMSVVLLHVLPSEYRLAGILVSSILLLTPLTCLSVLPQAHHHGEMVGIPVLVQSVVWVAGLGLVVTLGGSLSDVAIVFVLGTIMLGIGSLVVARQFSRIRPTFRWWRPAGHTRSQAVAITLAGVATFLAWRLDLPVVYGLIGASSAGRYALAYRVLDQLIVLPASFSAALIAVLGRERTASVSAPRLTRAVMAFGMLAPLLCWPFTGAVADAVFGPHFSGVGQLVRILVSALPAVCVRYLLVAHLIHDKALYGYALGSVIYLLVSTVALVALTLVFGVVGSAAATTLAEVGFVTAAAIAPSSRKSVLHHARLVALGLTASVLFLALGWITY